MPTSSSNKDNQHMPAPTAAPAADASTSKASGGTPRTRKAQQASQRTTSPSKRKQTAATSKPTEAQKRANKANAAKSTGPRTAAGKQSSASNSLHHGLYANGPRAILRGALSEDPEEVAAFVEGIVAVLDPGNQLEDSTAREIALHHLRIWRLDRIEAELMNGGADRADEAATKLFGSEYSHELELAWLERTLEWLNVERARLAGQPPPEGEVASDQPENGHRFDVLAQVMRIASNNAKVEDIWTDTKTPKTELEWYRAFRALLNHRFPDLDGLEQWIFQRYNYLHALIRERKTTASIRTANSLLAELDRTSEQRGRFTKQLQRAEDRYRKLQSHRTTRTDDEENVGTNPI